MKKTRWMNCIETKPVRIGYYEVRLWESKDVPAHYGSVLRYYFDGKNWRENKSGNRLIGDDRPGWHMMDEWRGIVKPNVE
jgi:hypothetical protein